MPIQIPQLVFGLACPRALPGQIADLGAVQAGDIVSRSLDTAAGANPGLFVVEGATVGVGCKLPTAASDITNLLLGVLCLEAMKMPRAGSPIYAQKDVVPVMRRGRVWVYTVADPASVAPDTTPFIVHSGADAGKVGSTAGTGTVATAFPAAAGNAKIVLVDATIGAALIEISMP